MRREPRQSMPSPPTLPDPLVFERGNIQIRHYFHSYPADPQIRGVPVEHAPSDLHVVGGGMETTIGRKGYARRNWPALTAEQERVVSDALPEIRRACKKISKYIRFHDTIE